MTFLVLPLLLTRSANAQPPSEPYANSMIGLGFAQSSVSDPYGVIRLFALGASDNKFLRGGDFDAVYNNLDFDEVGELTGRLFFGRGSWLDENTRLAFYTGVGAQISSRPLPGESLTTRLDLVVPFHTELGWRTDDVAFHVRGGLNYSPYRWDLDDDERLPSRFAYEATVSTVLGFSEGGRRVVGLRLEGGLVNGLWTILLGWGG